MRILLAVKGCAADSLRGTTRILMETWGKDVNGADLRVFIGSVRTTYFPSHLIEVLVPCPDDYHSLQQKTREILKWSLKENYDFTCLLDTDTFVIPHRLLSCGFEKYNLT